MGFDPLWFAMLVCVNLQMWFLTPPFAYTMFYLKGIAPPEVAMVHIYQGVDPSISTVSSPILPGGTSMETLTNDLLDLILKVANGEVQTNTGINRYFEMGIWRDGIST